MLGKDILLEGQEQCRRVGDVIIAKEPENVDQEPFTNADHVFAWKTLKDFQILRWIALSEPTAEELSRLTHQEDIVEKSWG